MTTILTRREFLKSSAAGGLTLALTLGPVGSRFLAAADTTAADLSPSAWLTVAPDGTVTLWMGKCEMGQGVYTSLPQIMADELEAEWARIQVKPAPAADRYKDPIWGAQATGGSTSLRHMSEPLRTACAAAREMLVAAAAGAWGVPATECRAQSGQVIHRATGRTLSYGDLAPRAARLPVPEKPRLKDPGEYRLVGKPIPRLDIPDKVQGAAVFGIDVREPDALQGAVARPPAYGAKLAGYDRAAAEAVADVRAVVELATGVAVVAGSREAALRGRDALKVRWDRTGASTLDTATLETTFLEKLDDVGLVAKDEGDAAKALREAIRKVEARYTLPYLAHTTMEPMNCTARVSADGCDVWVPTQNQTGVQQLAAQISGLPPEQVRVHTTYLGCGLGRRFEVDVVRETLALAKATKATVQVIWSREEDVQNDFYRPGNACIIRGGLDASGKIVAWQHRVAAPSIFARAMPGMVKDGVDPAAVEGIEDTVYRIPNLRVEYVRVDLPVPVGFWRSVGNSHNAFTVESFIDELAHAAGQDPLAFRLAHLPEDSPARALLQWVAEKAGWGRPPGDGRALGIAQHHSFGSYVAQVAEVSVDRKDGRVRVHRIVAAVDCGQVVNPDTVTAQIEGAVVMGLSAALKERVTFRNGGVSSENFQDYDLLRMDEVPEIQVHVRPSGGFLGGVGEPGLPPTAPAVANAVFAATGVRVRTLPMTPSLILETLKKG